MVAIALNYWKALPMSNNAPTGTIDIQGNQIAESNTVFVDRLVKVSTDQDWIIHGIYENFDNFEVGLV